MTFLSYYSNFCQKASKMVKSLNETFGKIELCKLTIIPKFHQNPITRTKVMTFLSYCSNFCQKAPKLAKILVENFWKVRFIQIDHHIKISSKSDH